MGRRQFVIVGFLLLLIIMLLPQASRWLEVKSTELYSERLERGKDPVKIDIPMSPTTEVYVSKANIYMTQDTVYFEQSYLNAAIFCYNKAIKLDPNLTLAYVNRGKVYSKQGQLEKAIFDYNRAIETNSNNAEAYRLRGFTYIEKGDLNQAIKIGSFFHPESYYLDRAKLYLQIREYDKSWGDVHKIELLGGKIDPEFLRKLKKESGSQK